MTKHIFAILLAHSLFAASTAKADVTNKEVNPDGIRVASNECQPEHCRCAGCTHKTETSLPKDKSEKEPMGTDASRDFTPSYQWRPR